MVGLVVAAGTVLWTFRPQLPVQPSSISYQAVKGPGEPAWGDGSDCSTVNGTQSCFVLPSIDFILTSSSPTSIALSRLTFYLFCNGSVYLSAPLSLMAWVPGSTKTLGAGSSVPQLGTCGTYVPPAAAWNRLAYYHQLVPGSTTVVNGDYLVLYSHTFWPPGSCPAPTYKNKVLVSCDDDFHGAPEWCYTVLGACTIDLVYAGPPQAAVVQIPLYALST